MSLSESRLLRAELNTLEDLIDGLPEESIIERTSLEYRKSLVEEELSSLPDHPHESVLVRLTFGGRPIVENQGVRADFGSAAVKDFTNAIATIGVGQRKPLQMRGALPDHSDYDLMITDIATGSFGFELQPVRRSVSSLLHGRSPIESAIAATKSILEASVGTDEELTNAISETHPRALKALHSFLKRTADQEAVCAVEFQDSVFRFLDVGQVRQSERRLRQENIHEEEQMIEGRFLGALPSQRVFEFLEDHTDRVISGRIDRSIGDVSQINAKLNRTSRIRVSSRRIGTANPRFVLLDHDCHDDLSG